MWTAQSDKIMKQNNKKERVNFLISKDYRNRFKQLCQKRGWIMSVVVENNLKKLVDSF